MLPIAFVLGILQSPADSNERLVESLTAIGKSEGISMIVELPESSVVINPAKEAQGIWTIVQVASATNTEWREVNGVHLFVRRRSTTSNLIAESKLLLLRVLNDLSDEDLVLAMNDGVNFARIPANDRVAILSWANHWPNLAQSSGIDAPQQTFDAFKASANQTNMTLRGVQKFVATSPEGRRMEQYSGRSLANLSPPGSKPMPTAMQTEAPPLTKRPAEGRFDFGDGKLISVRDLLRQAKVWFEQEYRVDDRVGAIRLFVSGRFTKDRFEHCMKDFLAFEEFHLASTSAEVDALSDRLADRMQKLLPGAFLGRGDRMRASELRDLDPNAYNRFLAGGMSADNGSVGIEAGFLLFLDPGVRQPLGTHYREFNGVTTKVTEHRQLAIGLGF